MTCSRVTRSAPLFSVRIHRLASARLKHKYGATVQLWYLDDGVIAGKLSDLELFFNELAAEFRNVGLVLNKLKFGRLLPTAMTFAFAWRFSGPQLDPTSLSPRLPAARL